MTLESAWASVKALLAEDATRWEAALASPIARSSVPARENVGRQIHQEQLAALIHAALEFQVRMSLMQKHRVVNMQAIGPLMRDLAGFAQAVANETPVSCRGSKCDWKGLAADAGPTGSCPTCAGRVYPDAPQQKILGPNGMVLQA